MTKPLRGVIRNTNAWSVFWTRVERDTSTGAMPPLPFVDFTREMLLVAGDGRRPSGHRIEIPGAASRGDTLFVLVRAWDEVTNPSGGMAAPVAVVRVPRAAGPVVFREEARASVGPKG